MSDQLLQSTTMAAILDLGRLVCSTLDLAEVFSRILNATRAMSGADVVSIMLCDEGSAELSLVAGLGVDPLRCAAMHLRVGEGVAGWVVQHGQPLHLTNPDADPRFKPVPGITTYGTLYVVPLHGRARVLGALNLSNHKRADRFSAEVTQTVEIFASHAAIAIENATTTTALRHTAARERISGMVLQAPRAPGAALPAAAAILAELGVAIEATECILMLPAPDHDGAWTRALSWPEQAVGPGPGWRPAGRGLQVRYAKHGAEIQAPIERQGGDDAWLLVRCCRPNQLSRRAEHELAGFAASQIGRLFATECEVAAEQRRHDLSQTLSRLSAVSNAMIGQEKVLDFILEQLARFISYDSAGVFVYHDDRYARMVAGRGFRFSKQDVVLYMGPGSLTWDLSRQREVVYVPDVQQIPGWQGVPDADIIRAWIGVPLLVNAELIGILTIDKWTPAAFGDADILVAQMFGEHLAVAIRNARLVQQAQSRASQLQVLHQLSVRLGSIREERLLLDEVARLLHTTFGYFQVVLSLIEGDEFITCAAYGAVNDLALFGDKQRYNLSQGLTGWAARHGQTLLVNDVHQDARFFTGELLRATRAELVVPIRCAGQVVGVINIESNMPGAFDESDVALNEALAGQTAVALENIRRYAQLQQTQEHLVHSERLRALGELSSGVAHDFNNLLTSILGHTQLLLADTSDPELSEGLQIIERAALDGGATVRRLQSFAQTSRAVPDDQIDLNAIIDESLAITRPRWRDALQSQGLQLTIERDLGRLPPLLGDGPALRELVTNLILNALDAMPAGGNLRLCTSLDPSGLEGQPVALLEVADSGIGMDEAVRARIFDPFFSTKGARGTGMGLAMVYSTVQRHRGLITVRSAPGGGSTFSVLLPLRRGLAAPAPAEARAAAEPLVALQILVVEDDPAVRRVLTQLLARLGHQVDAVEDGARALDRLAARPYELICSDLGMPGMSGWELIDRARQQQPDLLTLLVTGWGEQISPEEAARHGVDYVLAKPFDAARLQQTIVVLTARRAAAGASER